MNIKPTNSKLTYLTVIVFSALFVFLLNIGSDKDEQIQDLKAQLQYKEFKVDSFKNKYNQTVAENKVAITSKEETIKKLSEEVFNLKKKDEKKVKEVTTLVRLHQKVEMKDIDIPFTTPVILKDTLLPEFKDSTENYHIEGRVLAQGVRIEKLAFYDTVSFRVVEKKINLFKKETVVQSIHTNPYYQTTGQQSIVLKKKVSKWHKIIKPAIFFIAGYAIKSKIYGK